MAGGLGRAQSGYDEMVFRSMVRDGARFYDPLGLVSEGTKIDFQVEVNSYLYGTRFMTWLARRIPRSRSSSGFAPRRQPRLLFGGCRATGRPDRVRADVAANKVPGYATLERWCWAGYSGTKYRPGPPHTCIRLGVVLARLLDNDHKANMTTRFLDFKTSCHVIECQRQQSTMEHINMQRIINTDDTAHNQEPPILLTNGLHQWTLMAGVLDASSLNAHALMTTQLWQSASMTVVSDFRARPWPHKTPGAWSWHTVAARP